MKNLKNIVSIIGLFTFAGIGANVMFSQNTFYALIGLIVTLFCTLILINIYTKKQDLNYYAQKRKNKRV